MRLVRYGRPGKEKPGLFDEEGRLRSLAGIIDDIDGSVLGARRIVNLPGISVTVAQMLAALRAVAGDEVANRVRFQRDELIERIVGSWPAAWDVSRARSLGLTADASFEAIVRAYIEDELR